MSKYTFNDFQKEASEFITYPREIGLSYTIHGLTGEAGEIANKFKKILRDQNGILLAHNREEIAAELGDVMWYCAALAQELGVTLEDVAKNNTEKLKGRKERGTLQGSGDKR